MNEIMPFVATRIYLEIIGLNEVSEKQASYDITHMWNLKKKKKKKKRYKWTYLLNRNRLTDFENKRMVTKGDRW